MNVCDCELGKAVCLYGKPLSNEDSGSWASSDEVLSGALHREPERSLGSSWAG